MGSGLSLKSPTRFSRDHLKSFAFPESRQVYNERDVILYALGVGIGDRPADPTQLRFTYEKDLCTLPTMAVVLAHPGFWAGNRELGIDWVRMLHGEQGLTLYRTIPVRGEVVGRSRIKDVLDRGESKGAILYYERDVVDAHSGELIATSRQTLMCRGNGGFSREEPQAMPPPHAIPSRAPDCVVEQKTLPQMALIYRLSGDLNPLHADPAVARKAGFEAPILHGLATYGIGGRAILEKICKGVPERLKSFDVRFTAPLYPGETVRTSLWVDGSAVSLRSEAVEREVVVMDNGRAEIA
jgi:acyl dehydratase